MKDQFCGIHSSFFDQCYFMFGHHNDKDNQPLSTNRSGGVQIKATIKIEIKPKLLAAFHQLKPLS